MALLKRWDFNVPIGHKKLKPFGAVKAQRGNQRQRLFDFPFSFFFLSSLSPFYSFNSAVNFVLAVLSSPFLFPSHFFLLLPNRSLNEIVSLS